MVVPLFSWTAAASFCVATKRRLSGEPERFLKLKHDNFIPVSAFAMYCRHDFERPQMNRMAPTQIKLYSEGTVARHDVTGEPSQVYEMPDAAAWMIKQVD